MANVPVEASLKRSRDFAFVGVLCIAGLIIRAVIAFNSGLSADEGSFLQVVDLPSWREIVGFLRLHESHPPVFYFLVRWWMAFTGGGVNGALWLAILISAVLVPASYAAGRSLYSPRAGVVAATLTAFSPALSEYGAQVRPYGLLPLLALASCYWMISAIQRGGFSRWAMYAVATLLMLYTHNWGWVVAVGEHCGAISLMISIPQGKRFSLLKRWVGVWLVILTVFSVWAGTFLYQVSHAGHSAIVVSRPLDAVVLVLFGIYQFAATMVSGTLIHGRMVALTGAIFAVIAASIFFFIARRREMPIGAGERGKGSRENESASRAIAAIIFGALTTAIILSTRSNLLLPRCLNTLGPLAILFVAGWLASQRLTGARPIAVGFGAGLVAVSLVSLYEVARTPRSNAREVASIIDAAAAPNDLLILAPEWYAASFNLYSRLPVEQIDFPYSGKTRITDFANVWMRVTDSAPLVAIERKIVEARRENRRVWFVSERHYLERISQQAVANAASLHEPAPFSVLRVNQIRDILVREYGRGDSIAVTGMRPRYDYLRAHLFSPN